MRHARTAVLAVAVWLASCASQPQQAPPAPAPPPPPPPAPPVVVNPGGITFAAVGDIMMGTDYPDNVLPDDDGVSFLASVTRVLTAADIAFGNLEGVLMDGGEAVKRCRPAARQTTRSEPTSRAPAAATTPPAATPPAATPPAATPPTVATPPAAPAATAPAEPAGAPNAQPSPPQPSGTAAPDTEPPATAPQFDIERADNAPAPGGSPNAESGERSQAAAAATTPTDNATAAAANSPAPASTTSPASSSMDTSANPAPTGGACFVFRSPTRYATYLKAAGFDVMSLANNHAQDFGDPGRDSSMRTLDAAGIHHSGRDGDVAEWTTRGRRFAMVAFAPNVGSHQLNDLVRAQEIVTDLAKKNDIVVVSFHGGAEGDGAQKLPFARELYAGEDRGNVVEFARTVIDAGADLVIGHGPHVMRPIELYRDRLIAYSLGNFATYYGISVNGIRGTSGVLTTRLADDGRFMEARFTPTVQIRPGGPQPDPQNRATVQLRELTAEAFPEGALLIAEDGTITRKP